MAIFPASGIAGLLGRASPYGAPLRQVAPTADQAVNQTLGFGAGFGPSIPNTGNQIVQPARQPDRFELYAAMTPEQRLENAQSELMNRRAKSPEELALYDSIIKGTFDPAVRPTMSSTTLVGSPNDLRPTGPGMGPADLSSLSALNPNRPTTGVGNFPLPSPIDPTPRPSAGTFNLDANSSGISPTGAGAHLLGGGPGQPFGDPGQISMNVPLAYDSFPVNRPSPNDFPVGLTGGGGLRPPPGGLFGFPGFPPPSDPPNNYPGYGGGSTGGGGGLMAEIPKAIEPVIQNASRSLNTGIGQIISKTMGTGGPSGPDYRFQDIVRPQNMQELLLGGLF